MYNKKSGVALDVLYGCVTTADSWRFMALRNHEVEIDHRIYFRVELDKVLGIFVYIIDYYRHHFVATDAPDPSASAARE